MSSIAKILPHYTYEDWVQWEGRWELLEGHPIAMSPSPVPKHQRVAAEIITEFILTLRQSGCKSCRVYPDMDFKIANDTILVPDILIVCGEINSKILDFAPALIVEILSPSTALRDRNTKYQLYEREGVKYYLIVDVEKETVEINHLSSAGYTLQTNIRFDLEEGCSIEPNFSSIFL
ncbi:MAG: hypothetical protein JWP88_2007 [Flaviaesturariibacter sp.]|nr:hypothetical protein [Flaviaesturariibacter sp.]